MKFYKYLFLVIFLLNFNNFSFSSEIYFIDLKKILNKSKAGKGAQDYLKKQLSDKTKKLDKERAALKKEETDLIAKKN